MTTKRLLFLGAPGCGKGTQASPISERYDIPHISTGEMFRIAVRAGTPLGRRAKAYLDQGDLVPDDIVVGMVRECLACPDCAHGFLLDGFPRSVRQAEALTATLVEFGKQLDSAILLAVERETLIQRLTSRRVCKQCGTGYNTRFKPPREAGVCDDCGGEVYQRADDEEATIRNRLAVYEQETAPVVEYYREAGLLREVDGNGSIDEITGAILEAVGA